MTPDFSAGQVATVVLEHLERRRAALVDGPDEEAAARVEAAVSEALVPVGEAYREAELPAPYLAALTNELRASLPRAWLRIARRYTALEARDFGVWRGGDPVARLTYVFVGLVLGGLILWAPFIPIWEKWFPFVLAAGGWWVPDLQTRFHKRRYARALGGLVAQLERAQPALEATVPLAGLLASESESGSGTAGGERER